MSAAHLETLDAWIERLQERAKREPLDCDISDYSDEWCAGFLMGQVNAFAVLFADAYADRSLGRQVIR